MVRWEAGTRERLQLAAMDLFERDGFEQTTAADIAASVGVTERTFFRHFADKREVLFDGQHVLVHSVVGAVQSAPEGASAWELVTAALTGTASFFPPERRPYAARRQRIIAAHPALQERELLKLAGLAVELAGAMRTRGVAEPTATIAAEAGMTVFGVAFSRWIAGADPVSLADLQAEGLETIRLLGH